jgi:ribose 5-phosphate isomerase B
MTDEERIRDMVRRVVYRAIGASPRPPVARGPSLITEVHVEETPADAELVIPEGALVTPLARQAAMARRITLVESGSATHPGPRTEPGGGLESVAGRTVAIGSDHGGFDLKETLKEHLDGLGFAVLDCGTDSRDPADYPDSALAVALAVTEGRAWRGIAVDGAGIGSCMAANKVPGVRAAMCYDQATAINSRGHNDANVLTLGAGMIDAGLGREIVTTWLATPAGGGRHARRVTKIMDIERRHARRR